MRERISLFSILIVCGLILCVAISTLFVTLSPYVKYTYITMIYVMLALSMWLERKNLHEFSLDRLALFILILSSFVRRRLGIENEIYFLAVIGVAGLVVLIVTILYWKQIPKTNFRWLVIGLCVAFLALIPIIFIESLQLQTMADSTVKSYGMFWDIVRRAIYEISFTAPIEEFLFRGFLWGYLRKLNWNESEAFWIQGVLFWFSHIGKIVSPFTLFLTIPILTFTFSELRKRSGQITPSILVHLATNSIVPIILSNGF